MSLIKDLSIFWQENAIYLAIYSVFALIVCAVSAGLENHNQLSDIAFSKIAIKASALLISSVLMLALSLYITGWHSRMVFNSELLTLISVTLVWIGLAFFLTTSLFDWSGLSFENPVLYKVIPAALLISPFVLFQTFAFVLGSGWSI